MSGHSKWSKVKHQKEATDAVKGRIFTKMAMAIIMAVRHGGGNQDPETNFKLRLAMEKARSVNMPKDKIERAIERGAGKAEGEQMQEVMYEAFGPGGVGIIIEATTDSKQRTVSEIKNLLERNGGVLAGSGAVVHSFNYVGLIEVEKGTLTPDEIMQIAIDSGATDIEENPDCTEIFTDPVLVHKIKETLTAKGLTVRSFEQIYKPSTLVPVLDRSRAESILRLLSLIEENESVQKVFANFDIPDEFLK